MAAFRHLFGGGHPHELAGVRADYALLLLEGYAEWSQTPDDRRPQGGMPATSQARPLGNGLIEMPITSFDQLRDVLRMKTGSVIK